MNNYDEIAIIIEDINSKIKEIDKQMLVVEDIKPSFGTMDTFIPELEPTYKEFAESLSNSIFRIQALNKIVLDDAINEYYDIFQELNSKCADVINELLENVNVVKPPIEVLDTTPILNKSITITEIDPIYGRAIITQDFIDRQIRLIKPIRKIINPRDNVIPVPKPIKPKLEIM